MRRRAPFRVARLFAEILQCDRNPFVIHLLIFGTELLAAVGGAVEELDDIADRRPFGRLEPSGAADVDHAVEIEIIHVVEERTHRYTWRFIADAKHFGARADRRNMLVAPSAIFQPQARNSGAVQVEPDALRLRAIATKALGVRHFYRRDQIDDHANLLALGRVGGSEPNTKHETCEEEKLNRLSHLGNPFPKGENRSLSRERGPDHPLAQSPRWNSHLPPRFTPFTKKFLPWPTGRIPPCLGCKLRNVRASAKPHASAQRRRWRESYSPKYLSATAMPSS